MPSSEHWKSLAESCLVIQQTASVLHIGLCNRASGTMQHCANR
jgi:hypothetical protein